MRTRALLTGAAAISLAGAAFAEDNTAAEAQANNPPEGSRNWGAEARVNTAAGAPGVAEDGTVRSAGAPSEEAVTQILEHAQEIGRQNDVAIIPSRTDETDISLPVHNVLGMEEENAGALTLRAFTGMDQDEDLLLTQEEWTSWSGWDLRGAPRFSEIDLNDSGRIGFGEYQIWRKVQAELGGDAAS